MIPTNASAFNPTFLRPGTTLSTSRLFYRHVGILTDRFANGFPTVISSSGERGTVVEEPLDKFRRAGDIRVDGYLGLLPQDAVLERARAKLGSRYSLVRWNCEQFVRYAHGLNPESPQLATMVSLFMLVLATLQYPQVCLLRLPEQDTRS